uniref:Uncharacterized protein n=1 Tax=Eucampia antarctica TaxID=49252 RepID=A0A7S2S0P4_9STRA|mmetsp:Transcript_29363/g.28236  ORF Transcript_29363/g.28236 Transcript_29363/m.28236 type:complete len:297 (+) Transcript_29363:295-1185(+)|eukprot:CAMPEP_0197832518 /NCGR_PEP_ID=MMETSP1437-20131217/15187_1 /TAXON_ID=49252 ORGANISM="Eucampia antarctica, Strain CCMP1452" /NCGR_SAMPLE_ID=MMETSP1437 /ASSEMBLY_ACC=CAM_ASM_001096 /LENGTH=296 /DNA_ID=CAMNT_0043435943 /DNA_START=286 /DNA_END=1176 /DNA_ORIENTATION=-
MSATGEATINPDGSTTFDNAGADSGDGTFAGEEGAAFEEMPMGPKGTDPAIYLVLGVLAMVLIWYFLYSRRSKKDDDDFAFFSDLDGEKFNLNLPAAVDEYYEVKDKCEDNGWEPGKPPTNQQEAASGPHRVLAQALMKRCIADIPLVTHIQKESAGMNKLYSQSMCSVKQWKTYQAAEAMVSAEVEEVRAEADEIEPGWSQVIWRQAMQYHNMLKNRHEIEAKQLAAMASKKAEQLAVKEAELNKEENEKKKIDDAEKAAEELIKQEEREKSSKEAFGAKNGGLKKGFLTSSKKK